MVILYPFRFFGLFADGLEMQAIETSIANLYGTAVLAEKAMLMVNICVLRRTTHNE